MAAVLLSGVGVGCGGDSGASATSDPSGGAEASSSFIKPGGKNQIPKFGDEADEDEREAASAVLQESIQARAAGEWARQCETLTAGRVKRVQETGASGNCASALKIQAAPLSETQALRANTMTGPIDALRVEGDRGFALYHGRNGKDYAMPMREEDGEWKVSSLTETELRN
ncbi:MAG: hypothetical protein WBL45_03235 [Solirubrobacterales bacterium]